MVEAARGLDALRLPEGGNPDVILVEGHGVGLDAGDIMPRELCRLDRQMSLHAALVRSFAEPEAACVVSCDHVS